ncbi:hypothetical protein PSTG_05970 [Puccinia striiformis f. sp. tritici PST-78]|uniref:DUF6534 domain-containing protein n=1 Tax=Puccinia striiformis f. sp. tritici PST-78 TaxID=1165861 RepID=A0A0L0VNJ9_9BASI|nr:hypothetical protein PSTG_05970 [Puccinia striiformis f. sp. tritici PST-78]
MRAMVLWVMGCSLLHTSWFEYIAYHYAVDGFHDVRLLNMVTPHLGAHVFLSRCLVTTSQLFFCYRLYVFSSRDWRGTSLAIILTLGHVASAIATLITFVRARYYTELFLLLPLGFLYSTTISGDILITGSLLYYLGKQKTHYIKTKSIIKRIMLLSFQTSFLTTALAIVSIGLLGAQRELGILYCLTLISAQLYLLSIIDMTYLFLPTQLVTLNSRFDFAKAFAEDANKSLSRSFRMVSNTFSCHGSQAFAPGLTLSNQKQGNGLAPATVSVFKWTRLSSQISMKTFLHHQDSQKFARATVKTRCARLLYPSSTTLPTGRRENKVPRLRPLHHLDPACRVMPQQSGQNDSAIPPGLPGMTQRSPTTSHAAGRHHPISPLHASPGTWAGMSFDTASQSTYFELHLNLPSSTGCANILEAGSVCRLWVLIQQVPTATGSIHCDISIAEASVARGHGAWASWIFCGNLWVQSTILM